MQWSHFTGDPDLCFKLGQRLKIADFPAGVSHPNAVFAVLCGDDVVTTKGARTKRQDPLGSWGEEMASKEIWMSVEKGVLSQRRDGNSKT